jgi:hypothetical protein
MNSRADRAVPSHWVKKLGRDRRCTCETNELSPLHGDLTSFQEMMRRNLAAPGPMAKALPPNA